MTNKSSRWFELTWLGRMWRNMAETELKRTRVRRKHGHFIQTLLDEQLGIKEYPSKRRPRWVRVDEAVTMWAILSDQEDFEAAQNNFLTKFSWRYWYFKFTVWLFNILKIDPDVSS